MRFYCMKCPVSVTNVIFDRITRFAKFTDCYNNTEREDTKAERREAFAPLAVKLFTNFAINRLRPLQ
jgi:hypothetical protein